MAQDNAKRPVLEEVFEQIGRPATRVVSRLAGNLRADEHAAPDLESILHELHDMADISAALLEDALGKSHEAITGRPGLYSLTDRQISRMLFAAYKTQEMARNTVEAYLSSVGLVSGGRTNG